MVVGSVVSLLLALAMAASPELHKHLHGDADHDDHECAATLLLDGAFEDAAPAGAIEFKIEAPLVLAYLLARPSGEGIRPLFLVNGVLEHGPPASGC